MTDGGLHTDVPADWSIIITDVIGSTKAIAAGQYKAVNMVGAACIAAVVNVDKTIEIPFIFGGDGATFAIPELIKDRVMKALAGARNMARASFGLDLRVGAVPISDLAALNSWVRIGKFRMSKYVFQPAFSGRGWDIAEKIVKDPAQAAKYLLPEDAPVGEADFSGLECRWKGIPSANDCKLALLIVSTTQDPARHTAVYQEILNNIELTLGSIEQAHPIQKELLSINWLPWTFMGEAAVRTFGRSKLAMISYEIVAAIKSMIGSYLFSRRIDTATTKWSEYMDDFVRNADFKKFDGMLRMVVDCTNRQKQAIEDFLQQLHESGQIAYGMHASPQAIVTCLISSYNGYHTHFVDGSDGGYAMAAVQLKSQLKKGRNG